MNITPMDMTSQRFRTALLGYEKHDVQSFLETAAVQLRALTQEKQHLLDESEELKTLLDEYRERERALRETMLAAQRVSEEMKVVAQRESEVIISRAEMTAQRLLEEAQKRQTTLLSEIGELKFKRAQSLAEVKSLLQLHLRMLDGHDEVVPAAPAVPSKKDYLLFDRDFDDDALTLLPSNG